MLNYYWKRLGYLKICYFTCRSFLLLQSQESHHREELSSTHCRPPFGILSLTMHSSLFLLLLCASVPVFINGKSLEASAYDQKYLPLSESQVLEQYKIFATQLLQNQPFSVQESITLNPFGIGHSLAVVNENVVLNVSSSGIEDVLKIGCYKITPAYRNLIKILSEDPNIKISSTIYTQQEDVYLAPGLGKLKTFVNLVDMTKDMRGYVEFVNSEIDRKLTNKISRSFFPTKDLSPKQLAGEYLAELFEYDNSWAKDWETVDEPSSFYSLNKTVQVPFIQTKGYYELIEKNNLILVKVPLKGSKANLILVKSKLHIVQLLKSGKTAEEWSKIINNLWNNFVKTSGEVNSDEWTQKHMSIKMPILKQISGSSSIISQLKNMGLSKTMCPASTANSPTNVIEEFGQLDYVDINAERVTVTSITGTKNIGELKQVANSGHSIQRRSPADEDASDRTPKVESSTESRQIPVGEPIETFDAIFDQPFYWTLEDSKIGPIFTGGVMLPTSDEKLPEDDFMKQFLLCK